VFRFVCEEEFNVLLSKLEPVKDELSLNDLLSPLSGTVKKKEYWGYYWAVHDLSKDLGLLENA